MISVAFHYDSTSLKVKIDIFLLVVQLFLQFNWARHRSVPNHASVCVPHNHGVFGHSEKSILLRNILFWLVTQAAIIQAICLN